MSPSAIITNKKNHNLDSINSYYHKDSYIETNGVKSPKNVIGNALKQKVENIDNDVCEADDEAAFFVADLGEVYRQHMRWKKNLPRVKPFYAVKCNPDPQVIRLLAELGAGFDCASKGEIEQVLKMGVDPTRIIYAQPCKTNSYVRYAEKQGVKQMTFDNGDELHKIKKLFPEAQLFLRISTDDSTSLCRLSLKFGAAMEGTSDLLALARELDLNVVGVSFHVGSGASDIFTFRKAVQDAHTVFEQARTYGYYMHTLLTSVEDYWRTGRYYVANAFTLACNIIARRTVEDPVSLEKSYMLYLNDGVYGNFSSIIFDHQHPVARVLYSGNRSYFDTRASHETTDGTEYSIWGPTCDGIDHISKSIRFDHNLDVGDWLYFEGMGAYTKCSATRFNGFIDSHDVIYVSSESGVNALLEM
ncbi:hypothetical protein DID88_007743 [Monilinia fructigena]|uniref:Ornithine decarboxylase n=1 Tax=Monilinia fructigena TaxID=38457 RepID=A0A395J3P5_9HELO|nr:hypothetical protein DID88_007743 [Monilinia fructigena]